MKHTKEHSTNRKGDLAEFYAVTWLWDNGYEVFKNCGCDGFIDFNSSADSICRRVQAFRSWPSVSFCFGDQRIRIGKSSTGNASRPLVPGEVVLGSDGNLSIGTGTDSLVIHELQKPGGKMLPVRDFLRGFKIPDGTILESESMDDLLVREK
mgnify:CR=1 FL=1